MFVLRLCLTISIWRAEQFFIVSGWAISCEYKDEGHGVYVDCQRSARKWQDSDGDDKYTTEIVAEEMRLWARDASEDGGGGGAHLTLAERKQSSNFDDLGENIWF